jgi:hypothetical protein
MEKGGQVDPERTPLCDSGALPDTVHPVREFGAAAGGHAGQPVRAAKGLPAGAAAKGEKRKAITSHEVGVMLRSRFAP